MIADGYAPMTHQQPVLLDAMGDVIEFKAPTDFRELGLPARQRDITRIAQAMNDRRIWKGDAKPSCEQVIVG